MNGRMNEGGSEEKLPLTSLTCEASKMQLASKISARPSGSLGSAGWLPPFSIDNICTQT